MPDMTMCNGISCTVRESCYRYIATPSEFMQAYFTGSPKKGDTCEYYINYAHDRNNPEWKTLEPANITISKEE